jgi:hypothetical protein
MAAFGKVELNIEVEGRNQGGSDRPEIKNLTIAEYQQIRR